MAAVDWRSVTLCFLLVAIVHPGMCDSQREDNGESEYEAYQRRMIDLVHQLQNDPTLGLGQPVNQWDQPWLEPAGHDVRGSSSEPENTSLERDASSSPSNSTDSDSSDSSSSSSSTSSDSSESDSKSQEKVDGTEQSEPEIDTQGTDLEPSGGKSQEVKKPSFPCPLLRSPPHNPPKSVHRLKPSDVKVIGALGDSLTAGRGAGGKHFLAMLYDFRGLSWSAGGDGSYVNFPSLPNILREYNPHLYGYSNGRDWDNAGFNMAITAATSNNLDSQARRLIHKMKNDPNVNFKNDWKVITVFIGVNDVCRACFEWTLNVENFKSNLRSALNRLHNELPRAFINLVEMMKVEMAPEMAEQNSLCSTTLSALCNCLAFPKDQKALQRNLRLREQFQEAVEDVVNSGKYDDREDFAVVLQPFYKNSGPPKRSSDPNQTDFAKDLGDLREDTGDVLRPTLIPKFDIDLSYFAADCFHYSRKGQATAGLNLYNNMLQPIGSKFLEWSPHAALQCPDPDFPYFATKNNTAEMLAVRRARQDAEAAKAKSEQAQPSSWDYFSYDIFDDGGTWEDVDTTTDGGDSDGDNGEASDERSRQIRIGATIVGIFLGLTGLTVGAVVLARRTYCKGGLYTRIV